MSAKSIEQVGAELVETSKSGLEDSLPLSTKLFPYIFIASRRMSLRTISKWLLEKHGVSLSAATISRALQHPEMHLERLAETISAPARYVAMAYGRNALDLLFREEVANGPLELQFLAEHTHPKPEGESDIPRWTELQDLAALWLPIPHEVKLLLEPYLRTLLESEESEEI